MSKSSTPKGTPVQRSPSDGLPEGLQSPQHSTPGSDSQQKKRISSLLQSPVRCPLWMDAFWFILFIYLFIFPAFYCCIKSLLLSASGWQSFREELDVLIQEQMKKGGSSSNLWALRQLADFMASHGSPAALPVSPSSKCRGERPLGVLTVRAAGGRRAHKVLIGPEDGQLHPVVRKYHDLELNTFLTSRKKYLDNLSRTDLT